MGSIDLELACPSSFKLKFMLSEMYPGQNLGAHSGPKVSFSLHSSYSSMAIYYQKMRQHCCRKEACPNSCNDLPLLESKSDKKDSVFSLTWPLQHQTLLMN